MKHVVIWFNEYSNCWCYVSPASKFVPASLVQMVMQVCDTRFILVRTECPYAQFELLYSCTQFVVGVTNGRESEWAPKSLVAYASVCERVKVRSRTQGYPSLPLVLRGEGVGYKMGQA